MLVRTAVLAALIAASTHPSFAEDPPAGSDWALELGGIYLYREAGDNVPLVFDGLLFEGGIAIIYNDDLGGLGAWGGVVTLTGQIDRYNTEFRGIFTAPADTRVTLNEVEATDLPPVARGFSIASSDLRGLGAFSADEDVILDISVERETTFNSIEGNIGIFNNDIVDLFVGVRGLWIGDELDFGFSGTPGSFPGSFIDPWVHVSNALYGPQLGIKIDVDWLSTQQFNLAARLQAGFMHVDAEANYGYTFNFDGPIETVTFDSSDRHDTGMIEFGLDGTLHITSNLGVTFGYNFIYIDRVATSTKSLQPATYQARPQRQGSVQYESALYQGGKISALWKF